MLTKILSSDKFILSLILVNSVIIFLSGFDLPSLSHSLIVADSVLSIVFLTELIVKYRAFGTEYFKNKLNLLDSVIILVSSPTILYLAYPDFTYNLNFLIVFRFLRIIKLLRFLSFIPGIESMLRGIQRAVKSSVLVIIGFTLYMYIVGLTTFFIFRGFETEFYANPLYAIVSTFKLFTLEGWAEIADTLAQKTTGLFVYLIYLYFSLIVFTGGVLGLSLVNSIFVDAMVSDNTDTLESKLDELNKKVDILLKQRTG